MPGSDAEKASRLCSGTGTVREAEVAKIDCDRGGLLICE